MMGDFANEGVFTMSISQDLVDIVRALVLNPEPIGAVKAQGDKEAFRGWEI